MVAFPVAVGEAEQGLVENIGAETRYYGAGNQRKKLRGRGRMGTGDGVVGILGIYARRSGAANSAGRARTRRSMSPVRLMTERIRRAMLERNLRW